MPDPAHSSGTAKPQRDQSLGRRCRLRCSVLCVYRHHDHDGFGHDDHNGDRHHEHANQGTHHTVDNHRLQHLVEGIDAAPSPRKLREAIFVSGYGGIGLRTVPVQLNLRVATFSADDACRGLCVYRHNDHHGDRHDDHDGDRHHKHADQDTHNTGDNHGLQHSAKVQGLVAVRCSRQLTVATFVSDNGCIVLRTVSVQHNFRVASVSADDVLGVL